MSERTYYVTLDGCDDSTHFTIRATDAQVSFLRRVADAGDEAGAGGCKPGLGIHEEKPPYWDGEDEAADG